jgi:hypothetical protein
MKKIIIACALTLLAMPAFAQTTVTFTLTMSTADAQRVLAAVGKRMGLGTDAAPVSATAAQAKAFLAQRLGQIVLETEGTTAATQAIGAVVPIQVQ